MTRSPKNRSSCETILILLSLKYLAQRHDYHGRLTRVNWSHFARDSHLDCDLDNVEELYKVRALREDDLVTQSCRP